MSWLDRILAAWRAFNHPPPALPTYSLLADQPDFWQIEDAQWMQAIQNSESGKKLLTILQNYVFRSAQQATQKVGSLEYHCGHARGIASTVAFFQSLSRVPAKRDESEKALDPRLGAFLESIGA